MKSEWHIETQKNLEELGTEIGFNYCKSEYTIREKVGHDQTKTLGRLDVLWGMESPFGVVPIVDIEIDTSSSATDVVHNLSKVKASLKFSPFLILHVFEKTVYPGEKDYLRRIVNPIPYIVVDNAGRSDKTEIKTRVLCNILANWPQLDLSQFRDVNRSCLSKVTKRMRENLWKDVQIKGLVLDAWNAARPFRIICDQFDNRVFLVSPSKPETTIGIRFIRPSKQEEMHFDEFF